VIVRNQDNTLTLRWVPRHTDVEGNEMADIRAKAAARSEWVLYGRNDRLVATVSLTHLRREITEPTTQKTKEWIGLRLQKGKRREHLHPSKTRAQEPSAKRTEGRGCALLPAVNGARPNGTVHERKAEENQFISMLVVRVG